MTAEDGQQKFVGSPGCLAELSEDDFAGYWRIEFEASLFYENFDDAIEGGGSKALWLYDEASEIPVISDPLRSEVYFVSFSGHSSMMDGYYSGEGLNVKGGVLMKNIYRIERVAFDTSS